MGIGNSFWQVMKQKVLLEAVVKRKSYQQNCNFSNSCHKNPGFFFSRTRILFGRQWSGRFFWKECLIANLMKKIAISKFIGLEAEFLITKIFTKLTFIASNFDNYAPNYLLCYITAVEWVHEWFPGKTKYDVIAAIIYFKFSREHLKHQINNFRSKRLIWRFEQFQIGP